MKKGENRELFAQINNDPTDIHLRLKMFTLSVQVEESLYFHKFPESDDDNGSRTTL